MCYNILLSESNTLKHRLMLTLCQEHHSTHIISKDSHNIPRGRCYCFPFLQMKRCQGFPACILESASKSGRKFSKVGAISPPSPCRCAQESSMGTPHFTKEGWGSLASDLLNFLPGPPQGKSRHTETPIPTWSPQGQSYHDSDICIQTMRTLHSALVRLPSVPMFQVTSLQVAPQGWHCQEGSQPNTQEEELNGQSFIPTISNYASGASHGTSRSSGSTSAGSGHKVNSAFVMGCDAYMATLCAHAALLGTLQIINVLSCPGLPGTRVRKWLTIRVSMWFSTCLTKFPLWNHLFYLQCGVEAAQAKQPNTKLIESAGVTRTSPCCSSPT